MHLALNPRVECVWREVEILGADRIPLGFESRDEVKVCWVDEHRMPSTALTPKLSGPTPPSMPMIARQGPAAGWVRCSARSGADLLVEQAEPPSYILIPEVV